jgi:hypothetical protein
MTTIKELIRTLEKLEEQNGDAKISIFKSMGEVEMEINLSDIFYDEGEKDFYIEI